jgi:hypothetical protein
LPTKDPLEGIEVDIHLATVLNGWLNEFSAALQEPFVNRFDELIKQAEQS